MIPTLSKNSGKDSGPDIVLSVNSLTESVADSLRDQSPMATKHECGSVAGALIVPAQHHQS